MQKVVVKSSLPSDTHFNCIAQRSDLNTTIYTLSYRSSSRGENYLDKFLLVLAVIFTLGSILLFSAGKNLITDIVKGRKKIIESDLQDPRFYWYEKEDGLTRVNLYGTQKISFPGVLEIVPTITNPHKATSIIKAQKGIKQPHTKDAAVHYLEETKKTSSSMITRVLNATSTSVQTLKMVDERGLDTTDATSIILFHERIEQRKLLIREHLQMIIDKSVQLELRGFTLTCNGKTFAVKFNSFNEIEFFDPFSAVVHVFLSPDASQSITEIICNNENVEQIDIAIFKAN